MRTILKVLTIAAVGVLVLFYVPFFPGVRTYRDVGSPPELPLDYRAMKHRFVVSDTDPAVDAHGLYAIYDERLYLSCQSTRYAVILTTFVSFTEWNASSIGDFRRDHPDLERFWPDPSRLDGGVAWVRNEDSGKRRTTACTR